MAKTIKIENDSLTVEISTIGAELQAIKCDGKDYLWNGDAAFWTSKALLLFPICGGLKDDKYTYKGKEYILTKHGYAKTSEFEAEAVTQSSVVFLLKSDADSKKLYPFDYELRVSYVLDGKSIKVGYDVKNLTDGEMYFSIGAHEGYACPEGIGDYTIYFDKNERLTTNKLNGNLLSKEYTVLGENTDRLKLDYKYFATDALTFLNLKSRSVTLKQNGTKKAVRVDFDGFDYMFVWTKPNAGYICIEPWCGIPDFEGTSFDITEKIGINKLEKGESFNRIHTITIEG